MARRRKKKGRRKGKTAIPLVQTLTLALPTVKAVEEHGFSRQAAINAVYQTIGISLDPATKSDYSKGATTAIVLLVESTIGRKIANKTGANRLVKKATGGLLSIM